MKCGLVFAAVLTLVSSTTHAAEATAKAMKVVVTATDGAGDPVPSDVWRREGESTVKISTRAVSTFSFNEAHCSLTVSFTAIPASKSLWTFVSDDWRPCYAGQDFGFHFGKNIPGGTRFKSAIVAYALASDPTQPSLGALDSDPTLKPGLDALKALSDKGDFGSVSYVSNEMSIALAKQGRTTQAEYFKVLALSSGLDSISNAQTNRDIPQIDPSPELDYWSTANSNSLQYSETATKIIAQYQADAGLKASGRLDWQTVKSTSVLAASDIDALDSIKRAAIAPITY